MEKIKIDSAAAFLYPMPMVLAGAVVDGRANFLAVGWVSRVNYQPPLFAIALGPHHTNRGIEENRQFSINIPDVSLAEKTDYCGIVSGDKTDKSQLFDVFYGGLDRAPLIRECPVCMACRLHDTVELPSNRLYIGEPQEVFTEERYLTSGKLDIGKIRPFTLTMPDNTYWAVGEPIGRAWGIGGRIRKAVKQGSPPAR
jgi:flavin reductase (DIM6/NTAB) family NADH-FMN oxidoreductase RutF